MTAESMTYIGRRRRMAANYGGASKTNSAVFLLLMFLWIPSEGLGRRNTCHEKEYFDHGTHRCESCCDICCFANRTGTAQQCSKKCPGYTARLLRDNTQKEEINTVEKEVPKRDSPNNNNNVQLSSGAIAAISAFVLVSAFTLTCLLVKRKAILRRCRRDPEQNQHVEAAIPLRSLQETAPALKPALESEVPEDAASANTSTEETRVGHLETGPSEGVKKPVQETVEGNSGAEQITLREPECPFFDSYAADDTQMKTLHSSKTEDSFGCGAQQYSG